MISSPLFNIMINFIQRSLKRDSQNILKVNMQRRLLSIFLCVGVILSTSPVTYALPSSPELAPSPRVIFSQMDDPELVRELNDEETLSELQDMEYQKEAFSATKGIFLSLIPGGGWGLFYANKKAQGLVPLLISLVGYGVGITYLSGTFNSTTRNVCIHTPSKQEVTLDTCSRGEPTEKNPRQHLAKDELSGELDLRYFETKGNYSFETRGTKYDGTGVGINWLLATYITTTLLGAIWSAVEIASHNDEIRKRVESTAQAPIKFLPTIQYDGQRALMGIGVQF